MRALRSSYLVVRSTSDWFSPNYLGIPVTSLACIGLWTLIYRVTSGISAIYG
jgi:hypothetical protein